MSEKLSETFRANIEDSLQTYLSALPSDNRWRQFYNRLLQLETSAGGYLDLLDQAQTTQAALERENAELRERLAGLEDGNDGALVDLAIEIRHKYQDKIKSLQLDNAALRAKAHKPVRVDHDDPATWPENSQFDEFSLWIERSENLRKSELPLWYHGVDKSDLSLFAGEFDIWKGIDNTPPEPHAMSEIKLGELDGLTLDALAGVIRDVNAANGWDSVQMEDWQTGGNFDKIPAKLALVHSEVSEALEAYRHDDLNNFIEEMADVVIRVLDTVGGVTDAFQAAIHEKVIANSKRGYKHGGKRL